MTKTKTDPRHQIIQVPLDKITRYHNNPRRNSHAVGKLKRSIEQFGFNQPIVLDKDYVIIAGDTRFMAATELDLDPVPCIVLDLPPEKARAYRIADNRVGEESAWDFDLLVQELHQLSEQGQELETLGFDEAELNNLLSLLPDTDAAPSPDDFKSYGDDIDTDYRCPSCGYEWSGQPKQAG